VHVCAAACDGVAIIDTLFENAQTPPTRLRHAVPFIRTYCVRTAQSYCTEVARRSVSYIVETLRGIVVSINLTAIFWDISHVENQKSESSRNAVLVALFSPT